MEQTIFNWLLQLPQYVASFGSWLTQDLDFIGVSPLGLFLVGSGSALLVVLGIHLVRLFVG